MVALANGRALSAPQWVARAVHCLSDMSNGEAIKAAAADLAATKGIGSGGVKKVFLADLHQAFASQVTLAEFKAMAVEAHFAGEIDLARCDLVQAFDHGTVIASQSECERFHWVRVAA
jgi:hypothetical protein